MPLSFAPALLTEILAAERALGRLDQALEDPARRHRYRADAARRTGAALVRLCGGVLDPIGFREALAMPAYASGDAALATATAELALALPNYLQAPDTHTQSPRADPDQEPTPAPTPEHLAVAAVRASLAEIEAFLAGDWTETAESAAGPARAPEPAPFPPPWSPAWLDAFRLTWSRAWEWPGTRALRLDRDRDRLLDGLRQIETAAAGPGLVGAADAMMRLLRLPDPDDHPPAPAVVSLGMVPERGPALGALLLWLAGGDLVARACRLHNGGPVLAPALARDDTWRAALHGDETAGQSWIVRQIQDVVDHDLDRLLWLDRIQADWEARIATVTRRSTSRLAQVIPWLYRRPAFTTPAAADEWGALLGLSRRGSYEFVRQLAAAGIVNSVPDRHGGHYWATEIAMVRTR